MRCTKLLVMICVLVLTANAFAVSTPHIYDRVDSGNYPTNNAEYNGTTTIYCKGPGSSPDNSPLHESANLTDALIGGSPNPYYIGDTSGNHPGLLKRIIFYNGTLHIDPTGKVGFWEKLFASGSTAGQVGTVIVEGHLFGPELKPWKNGTTMKLYVMDGGLLELNLLRLGYSEGTPDTTGEFYLSGGLAKLQNLTFYQHPSAPGPSFIDITGGELLIKNSNWSVAAVEAAIAAGDIFNSNEDEGYLIEVTTRSEGGTLYTSVTLVFDPLGRAIFLIGAAIDEKDYATEVLNDAIAMETAAKGLLDDVLAILDPEDPNYEDVEKAQTMTNVAIIGERSVVRKIDKTVKKLDDALGLLAGEGGGPKPPK